MDPVKILAGIIKSWSVLGRIRPDVIFSKGGFVAFPVVFAGWLRRIPIIAHESDLTPGLATKLSMPFVQKMCLHFEASKQYFKDETKLIVTGNPVREFLFHGKAQKALEFLGVKEKTKPVVLVMGGSLGSQKINQVIEDALEELLAKYMVIHIVGNQHSESHIERPGYYSFSYIQAEMADIYALSDVIINRAGAGAIAESLSLRKKVIYIPLGTNASRGDQIKNAKLIEHLENVRILSQGNIDSQRLLSELDSLMNTKVSDREWGEVEQFSSEQSSEMVAGILQSTLMQR